MRIHNLMEDTVIEKVKEVFGEEINSGQEDFCKCPQCELDVACYVLNNIPPKYILSGRGLAHYEKDYLTRIQTDVDLATLVQRGIEAVSSTKRPHFNHNIREQKNIPVGDFFNIPALNGRIFNSLNFEPISGISVCLRYDGDPVAMISPNWQNPHAIASNTPGTFNFWPVPYKADRIGEQKNFEFEVTVDDSNFEPFRYYFDVRVVSEGSYIDYYRLDKSHQVKDVYLVPK